MGKLPEDRVLVDLLEHYTQAEIAGMYGVTRQAVNWRMAHMGREAQPRPLGSTGRAVFEAIIAYKRAHDGNSPTVRELSEYVGRVYSVIYHHLHALERHGLIRLEEGTARQICVVGGRWEWDGEIPPQNSSG